METYYKKYKRKGLSEMTEWKEGFNITNVAISLVDKEKGSPKEGDMIARNPKNHEDKWLVAKKYFDDNLELYSEGTESDSSTTKKTLVNTDSNGTTKNVKDVVFWGNGNTFKLISKASSKAEGWMKSTKAMEIIGAGCVIQVTTQQGDNIAEALTFVPDVKIKEIFEGEILTSRIIVKNTHSF